HRFMLFVLVPPSLVGVVLFVLPFVVRFASGITCVFFGAFSRCRITNFPLFFQQLFVLVSPLGAGVALFVLPLNGFRRSICALSVSCCRYSYCLCEYYFVVVGGAVALDIGCCGWFDYAVQ
ncbi:12287_t:CDS:2, partial [Racocetra persica]